MITPPPRPSNVSVEDLRQMPAVVDIVTAGQILGIGRTKAYELAKRDQFPCRVLRIGALYRVPTAELMPCSVTRQMRVSRRGGLS